MATPKEIEAVRKVLFEGDRLRELRGLAHDIQIVRIGQERQLWYIPHTGKPFTSGALECDKIATLLLQIRDDLRKVDFDRRDKASFETALSEHAAAFRVRARAWRSAAKPKVDAVVAEIARHDAASIRAYVRLKEYFV
jgi:hypothetical protein